MTDFKVFRAAPFRWRWEVNGQHGVCFTRGGALMAALRVRDRRR